MEIRPIEAGDRPALSGFFERMPESDRTFLKEDVGDPRVLEDWVQPGAGRAIAVEDGAVVGAVGGHAARRLVEPRRRGPARRRSRPPRPWHRA